MAESLEEFLTFDRVMEFAITLATSTSSKEVADSIDAFLRTSEWGVWSYENGDHVSRVYRRGRWTRELISRKLVGDQSYLDWCVSANWPRSKPEQKDDRLEFPSWPLELQLLIRPAINETTIKIQIINGIQKHELKRNAYYETMEGWLKSFVKKEQLGSYHRYYHWCLCADFLGRAVDAEVAALVSHITKSCKMTGEPKVSDESRFSAEKLPRPVHPSL